MPVLLADSQATLDQGSSLRQASRMASETCARSSVHRFLYVVELLRHAPGRRSCRGGLHRPGSSKKLDQLIALLPSRWGSLADSLVKRKWLSACHRCLS